MPSGYTAEILDGKVTTGKEFAEKCARAFMFNMRDVAWEAPLRMPERYDSYYGETLGERLAELEAWDNSSEEEKYAKWSEYAETQEKNAAESRRKAEENRRMLMKVRDEVVLIRVPETHRNFREFMLDQIDETIKFDATYREEYNRVVPYVEWVESQRGYILRAIQIATDGLADAEERYQKGREWVSKLAELYGLEIED